MINRSYRNKPWFLLAATLMFISCAPLLRAADLHVETIKAWNSYVQATERRMADELSSTNKFLVLDFQAENEARNERRELFTGKITITKLRSVDSKGGEIEIPDAMIHHWRGSVFIPHVTLDSVFARVANPSIEDTRQEDVLDSAVLERAPGSLKLYLKLQRSKIITVVYNTEHQVHYQRQGTNKAWSRSIATKIAELENPQTVEEREKPEGHDRGFLWRLNSYWRYQQVDGGVIVECESITLSRSIPAFLKPFVGRLVNNVARESMERTLESLRSRLLRSGENNTNVTSVRFPITK